MRICQLLEMASSIYGAAKACPPSQRSLDDSMLSDEILRGWENYEVYGADKVWLQLNREGVACGREWVDRMMKYLVRA